MVFQKLQKEKRLLHKDPVTTNGKKNNNEPLLMKLIMLFTLSSTYELESLPLPIDLCQLK